MSPLFELVEVKLRDEFDKQGVAIVVASEGVGHDGAWLTTELLIAESWQALGPAIVMLPVKFRLPGKCAAYRDAMRVWNSRLASISSGTGVGSPSWRVDASSLSTSLVAGSEVEKLLG